ncbi:unnamed protein product [Lampetra fluviatilis]
MLDKGMCAASKHQWGVLRDNPLYEFGEQKSVARVVSGCEVRQGVPGGLVALHVQEEEEAVTWLYGYVG